MDFASQRRNIAVLLSLLAVLYLFDGLSLFRAGEYNAFRLFSLVSLLMVIIALGCYKQSEIFYKAGFIINLIGTLSAATSLVLLFLGEWGPFDLLFILLSLTSYLILLANFLVLNKNFGKKRKR